MVGFQLFSRRPCAGRQKQERFFVTWRGPTTNKSWSLVFGLEIYIYTPYHIYFTVGMVLM